MASLLLKNLPLDVRKFIIKMQGEIKYEKGISQYSMELTMYKIIKEHPKFALQNEQQNKC